MRSTTVFAPTNDAFSTLDKATLDKVTADPTGLQTIVLGEVQTANATVYIIDGVLLPAT